MPMQASPFRFDRDQGQALAEPAGRPQNRGAMMSFTELSLAVLLLLLTPGPSNSLMLVAGAERGWARAMRRGPAELAGYLLSVVPLAFAGAAVLEGQDMLRSLVTVAAGTWVAVLAARLWRLPDTGAAGPAVDARALFVTTALNPKALIFGLVLIPSPDRTAMNLVLFAGLVVLVAAIWAAFGAALRQGPGQPRALFVLRRLASVWLAAISVVLIAQGVGA